MRLVKVCLIAAASLAGAYGIASAAPGSGLAVERVAPQATEASAVEKVHWRKRRRVYIRYYSFRPRYYGYYGYYTPYYHYSYYPRYYRPYRPYRRSGVWIGFRF